MAAGVDATYSIPPWIARFNGTTGNKEADVALPVKFLPCDGSGNPVAPSASNQSSGVVSNLSLECLGITPSKKVLFTANEAALKQDYNGTFDGSTNQAQNSLPAWAPAAMVSAPRGRVALPGQNLERDAPRTAWIKMIQPR